MKTIILLLALTGSALAYAFSGGYHPVPHFTPSFRVAPRISPSFRPSTAPHYTPSTHVESHPYHSPALHPYVNPAHPMYWVYHRNPATGRTDSTPAWSEGEDPKPFPWKYVAAGTGGFLLVLAFAFWIRRTA